MIGWNDILLGLLLPAVIAGLLVLLTRRSAGGWPGALAIGGGYVAGHVGVRGWRGVVPRESTDWILVSAAAATVLAAVLCAGPSLRPRQRILRPLLMWAASSLAAFCLLRRVANDAVPEQLLIESLQVGALVALFWKLAQNVTWDGRAELPGVLLVTGMGAATIIGLSGSQTLGQLAGALTAALGGAAVAALLGRTARSWDGALAVTALVLGSLALAAHVFSDLPAECALLVAAGPTVFALARGLVRRLPLPRPAVLVMPFVAQLAVVGWAVHRALAASPSFEGL